MDKCAWPRIHWTSVILSFRVSRGCDLRRLAEDTVLGETCEALSCLSENIRIAKEQQDRKYTVGVASNRYAFRAEKLKKEDPLALKRLQDQAPGSVSRSLDQFRRDFLLAPFSVRFPVDEFLWDPKVTTIDRVTTIAKEGRELTA